MFNKLFKKKEKKIENNNVLIGALLIHAAKIDENYTDVERNIIKKALISLYKIDSIEIDNLIKLAEKKEKESNQIVEFTKEIKKNPMEFRLKIIEVLWEIIYSDRTNDEFESNLVRRICGLLYISDKDNGIIKARVKSLIK